MGNWVKIHRKIVNWEWYGDVKVTKLWLHLLLTANYEDKTWRGISIKRGQLLTSLKKLAAGAAISVSAVRRCLNNLQNTNDIAYKSTNKYTLITICNYDSYQCREEEQQQTNRHTNSTQIGTQTARETTTTKEYKENKERKNNSIVVDKAREIENFRSEIYSSQIKLESACKSLRLDPTSFLSYAEEVLARWECTDEDAVNWSHLINAIAKRQQADANKKPSEAEAKAQRRAQLEAFAQRCYLESIQPTNKN